MAQSSVSYLGDGTTSIFTVTFPSLSNTHVSLFVDGVEDTGFTWVTESTISASSPPANGAVVLIQRTTPTTPLVDFDDGSNLIEELLDTATRQALYVAEESADDLGGLLQLDTGTDTYNVATKRVSNLGTPLNDSDAATKAYADEVSGASNVTASQAAEAASLAHSLVSEGHADDAEAASVVATAQAVISTEQAALAEIARVAAEAPQLLGTSIVFDEGEANPVSLTTGATAPRSVAIPDKSGTLALTSDLAHASSLGNTYTNGGTTVVAHGAGATPLDVKVFARCVIAQHGYSVGDYFQLNASWGYSSYGYSVNQDGTNLTFAVGSSGLDTVRKTGSSTVILTPANWEIDFYWKDL